MWKEMSILLQPQINLQLPFDGIPCVGRASRRLRTHAFGARKPVVKDNPVLAERTSASWPNNEGISERRMPC